VFKAINSKATASQHATHPTPISHGSRKHVDRHIQSGPKLPSTHQCPKCPDPQPCPPCPPPTTVESCEIADEIQRIATEQLTEDNVGTQQDSLPQAILAILTLTGLLSFIWLCAQKEAPERQTPPGGERTFEETTPIRRGRATPQTPSTYRSSPVSPVRPIRTSIGASSFS